MGEVTETGPAAFNVDHSVSGAQLAKELKHEPTFEGHLLKSTGGHAITERIIRIVGGSCRKAPPTRVTRLNATRYLIAGAAAGIVAAAVITGVVIYNNMLPSSLSGGFDERQDWELEEQRDMDQNQQPAIMRQEQRVSMTEQNDR
eukprot:Gregarina_sp_Poly_1__10924@NODE_856_length_5950_cov_321_945436_g619_i0_p3_GENE_NODE_856_length_5950_cov_321_945436_g619_i0NODE_856_length_5950_cov_321_945436_g619_i0_p3_ORF_typecomplete_len145_score18_63RskA/PF10099_9/0_0054_NODE_856_length_5950_cov_321_945436_g619_i042484682